jgi:stage IV sporulation protein FB
MIIRIPGKIPIAIYPAFWIFAALIGFLNSGMSIWGTLIWVGIILVSILVHEMGHALTAILFGLKPRIELVALGGLTTHDGGKLPFWKQFLITLDGPLFGFFLFIGASLLKQLPYFSVGTVGAVVTTVQQVNLFWTILNLLPVMPLDGGQLLRIALEAIFGVKGLKYSLMAGAVIAGAASLFFFLYQAFLVGGLFFLLAYQSYDTWRQSRMLTEGDRSDEFKRLFDAAEMHVQQGRKEEALAAFESLRTQAKRGLFYSLATQYVAALKNEKGQVEEIYDLLLPLRAELSGDALCLLHKAAFEKKNHALVLELAGTCYQNQPSAELALRNAFAAAALSKTEAAVGWLQTALSEGVDNIAEILKDPALDPIRTTPAFRTFQEIHSQ